MEPRTIDVISNALKASQMARHPLLTDYSSYSVLTTLNQAASVQIQYVETRAKDAIEANSVLTATGTDLDRLVVDRGLTRQPGTAATGTVVFRKSLPADVTITIPIGTRIQVAASDSITVFFATTAVGIIDVGYTSATVAVQAIESGTTSNIPMYSPLTIVGGVLSVERVENVVAFTGGTDQESDDSLRDRYKYATDVNGKATLPLVQQHILDLLSVRECKVYTQSAGEIEIVADSTTNFTTDTDVVIAIEDNIAVGIVSKGKTLATVTIGIITPQIDVIAGGQLHVRVESTYVVANESMSVYYTSTLGQSRTGTLVIPAGSVKGDTIAVTMQATTDYATEVTGFLYSGSHDFTILGGLGTYPYLYLLPRRVLVNVQITIKQTATPDPDLQTKIENSISAFLDAFEIGVDLEFSDLAQWIYSDFATNVDFVGIDQIQQVVITAKNISIVAFGQTISISDDERCDPGNVAVTLA